MGEEFGEEGSCAGERGADNGDVAFDGGPGGCTDIVVWGGSISLGFLKWECVVGETYRLGRLSWR